MSNDKMREALVMARTGLVWYHENYPQTFSECDNEALEQIDAALAQQASEPAQFKFPRHPDPESPWVIDFDFLMKVRDLIEDVDFAPCLEEVEEVLRAVEELYPTLSKPELSQPIPDSKLKEIFDGIDFSTMVTADDLFYLIAREVEKECAKSGVSQPVKELFLKFWTTDMENSEYFNRMSKLLGLTNGEYMEFLDDAVSKPAQVSQPVAWLFPDIGMTTTSVKERDRWLAEKRDVTDLYLAPPDYEALKWKYEGALESIRDHQKIGGELNARIAELEFENSSIPEHQQIGKEIAAERDVLKMCVDEYKASAEQDAKTMTKLHHDKERLRGVLFGAETDRDNTILERDKLQRQIIDLSSKCLARNLTIGDYTDAEYVQAYMESHFERFDEVAQANIELQSECDLSERKLRIALNNVPATVRFRLDMQMAEMRLKVREE